MNQHNLPIKKPVQRAVSDSERIKEFLSENREYFAVVAWFIGVWAYDEYVGLAWTWKALLGLGKDVVALGKNVLSWAVAAVVVLCLFRLLWPFVRPFVCMAIGLIACWVLWRLGVW